MGVGVGGGVCVGGGAGVLVGGRVGVGVSVGGGVLVTVGVTVGVGLLVGVGVTVGVAVEVGVGVLVGVGVKVGRAALGWWVGVGLASVIAPTISLTRLLNIPSGVGVGRRRTGVAKLSPAKTLKSRLIVGDGDGIDGILAAGGPAEFSA